MNSINLLHQDTEMEDLSKSAAGFEITGDKPHMVFSLAEPCKRGWYQIHAHLGGEKIYNPKVYLNTGAGFSEAHALGLKKDKTTGAFSATFFLPIDSDQFRFDPSEGPTTLEIHKLEIKPLQGLSLAKFLTGYAVNIAKTDPQRLVKRWREYALFLKKPHFINVQEPTVAGPVGTSYEQWIEEKDFNLKRDGEALRTEIAALAHQPKISVVMPTYNTPVHYLDECIQSVVDQVYENWELCIADDCSPNEETRDALARWEKKDPRIKVVYRKENGHISAATNSAIEIVTGDWIALLDHDDLIPPQALAKIAIYADQNPDAQMIYSDEDKLDLSGKRKEPYFKTDWNYHLFLSQNMFSHLGCYKASLIKKVGGFRLGFEGSQDYDLALRCIDEIDHSQIVHIPEVLYHWRQIPGSTALDSEEKPYAMIAGERSLNEHFKRNDEKHKAELIGFGYRIRRALPTPLPEITIIIPTKDGVDLLKQCITSIQDRSTYSNYNILIIDNNSEEKETFDYFKEIESSKVRILKYQKPFNFSGICNFAVSETKAPYVVLLNNDTEVLSPGWLEEMLTIAIQEKIGAVGARLWYPDERLQHVGLVLSPHHIAMNAHKHGQKGHHGYFGRASLTHECSAVTAACLMVSREKYLEVGGMNADDLAVAYNDVDFCLKLGEAGYKNVCATFADLYHHESATRDLDQAEDTRFQKERAYMLETWKDALKSDPMYNQHLTDEHDNFTLRI